MRKRIFEITKNFKVYKVYVDNESQYVVETERNTFYSFLCEYSVIQFIDNDSINAKEDELRNLLKQENYCFKEYIK